MNKKINFGAIIFIVVFLLSGMKGYAADGDLIVDGQLQVTGEVSVYRVPTPSGCASPSTLITSATCQTVACGYSEPYEAYYYYTCSGACYTWTWNPEQCNTVYVGKLYP